MSSTPILQTMTPGPATRRLSDADVHLNEIEKRIRILRSPTCLEEYLPILAHNTLRMNSCFCCPPESTIIILTGICYASTCCGLFCKIPLNNYFCIRHYTPGAFCHRGLFYLFHKTIGSSSKFLQEFPHGGAARFCLGTSKDSFEVNDSTMECNGLCYKEIMPEFPYNQELRDTYACNFELEKQTIPRQQVELFF